MTAPVTPKQNTLSVLLDQIEERANAATPGPWERTSYNAPLGDTGDYEGVEQILATTCRQSDPVLIDIWNPDDDDLANLYFIASARTDVPNLVKALRRAVAALEDSHSVMDTEGVCHAGEHPDDGCPACVTLRALPAILTSPENGEEKQQGLGK